MEEHTTRQSTDALLAYIGAEGMSGIKTPSPTAVDAIAHIIADMSYMTSLSASRLANELRRQDLITFTKESEGIRLQLTVKGIHRLQRAQINSLTIPTPAAWDRTWRMVVFDIPARHSESRYILTSQLKRLGFVMIRRSMWLHPYPCFNEVLALLQYANIQPFVTLAEISQLDKASSNKLVKSYPELQ